MCAYLILGLCTILWSYIGQATYGSEVVLGSVAFLSLLAFPLSYPFGGLMFQIINSYWPNKGLKLIPMLILLAVGFVQWFYLFPWASKWIRRRLVQRRP